MSFVPVLAALAVLGLWPAMVVATVSGATALSVTKDPQKILFDISNYVLSTFIAGVVFMALVPADAGFLMYRRPAFLTTAVDFIANTVVLAGVVALSTGRGSIGGLAPELPVGPARLPGGHHLRPSGGAALRPLSASRGWCLPYPRSSSSTTPTSSTSAGLASE